MEFEAACADHEMVAAQITTLSGVIQAALNCGINGTLLQDPALIRIFQVAARI